MSKLVPKYTFWEGLNICLEFCMQLSEEIKALARIPGPAGKDGRDGENGINGKDGADAVLYDDLKEWYEDDGRFLVKAYYLKGKQLKDFRHQTKAPIWRGVWDEKRTYLPGDEVTWKNSVWSCEKESTGSIGSDSWTLKQKRPREVKPEDVAKFLLESRSEEVAHILARLLAERG